MEAKINADVVIGVDPGQAGGIAVFIPGQKCKVVKMPKNISDLRDFFAYYAENFKPVVFLEKLSVRPDDVKVENDRAALGKLYRVQKMMANFEHLKAILETVGIPYVLVHPMTWQTKLNLRNRAIAAGDESREDRKRRYRLIAGQKYPSARVTLWNADALLIMHFGRWALVNDLKWVRSNLPEREHQKLF